MSQPVLTPGLAKAVELVGERWAIQILGALIDGPHRFTQLRSILPGISANILARRLEELQTRGLVRRSMLPPPASVHVYEATAWATEARTALDALGNWAKSRP
jgi:DNA-binding HxlR family transcriptional regulator